MIDILRKRKSVRDFLGKKIEEYKIDILKESILHSPSSKGIYPCEFIFINNKIIINELSKAKVSGSLFLKNSVLTVVFVGDKDKSDMWVEDCSISAVTLQYCAESLNLSSCWSQIRKRYSDNNKTAEQFVRNLLNIPNNYGVECIVGIGYPAVKTKPRNKENLNFQKIRIDKF